jgi:DNA-binding FrmR family transcriptional regulator
MVMKDIQNRLKRIEGQVRGLQTLLESPDDCEKIITQFQAAQGAFDVCFSKLLHDNLQKCLLSQDPEQLDKILKLLVKKQ